MQVLFFSFKNVCRWGQYKYYYVLQSHVGTSIERVRRSKLRFLFNMIKY